MEVYNQHNVISASSHWFGHGLGQTQIQRVEKQTPSLDTWRCKTRSQKGTETKRGIGVAVLETFFPPFLLFVSFYLQIFPSQITFILREAHPFVFPLVRVDQRQTVLVSVWLKSLYLIFIMGQCFHWMWNSRVIIVFSQQLKTSTHCLWLPLLFL